MKILIINPNSDPDMTRRIQESAERFADGEYEVECRRNAGAPAFIESYQDQAQAQLHGIPLRSHLFFLLLSIGLGYHPLGLASIVSAVPPSFLSLSPYSLRHLVDQHLSRPFDVFSQRIAGLVRVGGLDRLEYIKM